MLWNNVFDDEILKGCLKKAAAGKISPEYKKILRCFEFFPPEETRVVILGQDPYPGDGVANGLAFSSNADKIPASLQRIYKQLISLGLMKKMPQHSNLEKWACQGVLLLNSVLTFGEDDQTYWETFTEDVIGKLLLMPQDIYFFLWGKKAQSSFANAQHRVTAPIDYMKNKFVLEYKHPSPLSRGDWLFEGFKLVNIDWDVGFIRFYTDGACEKNGKKDASAGWAVIPENYIYTALYGRLEGTDFKYEGGKLLTVKIPRMVTNQRAEGYAIVAAILKAKHWKVTAEIVTDSMYWINVCTKWMQNWKDKSLVDERKNSDLIKILLDLTREVSVRFIHQNSHTAAQTRNALGNDQADKYAGMGMKQTKFFVIEKR